MKFIVVLWLFLCVQAFAQSAGQIVTPTEASTCGDFMAARRENNFKSAQITEASVNWIWGYLSRYNRESPKNAVIIPTQRETVMLILEKYCRVTPTGYLIQGADSVVQELGGNPEKSWKN